MERLYGSHNQARSSRIVCQPSDVILWINTPFDTKNFKRKYESLIKLHHFWRWYFLFFGEAVKKKLTDFGQLFCYPKFFKNKKKKIDRFRPTFLADRKKVGRNSVSPVFTIPWSSSRPSPTFRAKFFWGKIFTLSVDWTVEVRNKRWKFATFLYTSKRLKNSANRK